MSLNLSRRLLVVATLGVIAAIALIVVSITATISTTRAAGVAEQLRAVDMAACNEAPQKWGLAFGEMSVFAYDRTGRSANPEAPAIEADLLGRAAANAETAESISPELTTFVVPKADDGPCAMLRISSPNLESVTRPRMLRVLATSLLGGVLLALAGTFWFVVRPLRSRIEVVAAAAQSVGSAQFTGPKGEPDALGGIADVLATSHERIVETRLALEARNAALEDHLAGIAHDLRTPLASLQLALEALAAEAGPAGQDEARRALADAVYLSGLVENLHHGTRLRHAFDVTSGEVELGELVRRLEARFAIIGRHAGVQVAANTPDHEVWVACTPALAERALANLIQNAIEHNEEPGHVAITLALVDAGRGFELAVADDGPGLPPETLASLQHESFVLDTARPRSPGMGMLITREVASRAGWSLAFEALEPRGLRVRVTGAVRTKEPGDASTPGAEV